MIVASPLEVLVTSSCVRPGKNNGEASGNLLEQSQNDTDDLPHEEHSRIA